MSDDDQLAENYVARYGLSFEVGVSLDDYMEILKDVISVHKGYSIIKIDSDRPSSIYTLAVNFFASNGMSSRKDSASISISMKAILADLERHGIYGAL